MSGLYDQTFDRDIGNETAYHLRLYEPDYDDTHRYTLTGQLYGIGSEDAWSGNHAGDKWIQENLDYEWKSKILFDTEQGQFFCYSDSLRALLNVVILLDEAFDTAEAASKILR